MTARIFVLSAILCLTVNPELTAQGHVEESLWRAIAQEIHGGGKPDTNVYLDPRVVSSSRTHSSQSLSVLRDALGARVAEFRDVVQCGPSVRDECRFVKGSLIISLTEPSFTGDSASVRVRITNATRERRRPIGQQEVLLVLRRQGNDDWRLIEKRLLYIT